MINFKQAKKVCCEEISLIENYEQAIQDKDKTWDIHHRLEIQEDKILSRQELKDMDLYYNRPANELIFITHGNHTKLHNSNQTKETKNKLSKINKGKILSEETKKKISESRKGKGTGNKSEETRKRMSEAQKGKHISEETKKKLSKLWKGKPRSEEDKKKMKEGWERKKEKQNEQNN